MKIKHSAFLISTILSTLFLIDCSDASEKNQQIRTQNMQQI